MCSATTTETPRKVPKTVDKCSLICIDQGNNAERIYQIRRMRSIFYLARRAFVRLKEDKDNSKLIISTLQYLGQPTASWLVESQDPTLNMDKITSPQLSINPSIGSLQHKVCHIIAEISTRRTEEDGDDDLSSRR